MWRVMLPLFEIVLYCSLCLAAFSVLSIVLCSWWESVNWRRERRHNFVA